MLMTKDNGLSIIDYVVQTTSIIGTALGAWALFGNRRSAGAIPFLFI